MKQFNVRDETHRLGRELSLKANRSVLDVVQEALAMYQRKLRGEESGDKLVDKFLREASVVLTERMYAAVSEAVREEVPKIIEATIEKLRVAQEELQAEQLRELEQLLAEAEEAKAALAAPTTSTLLQSTVADGAVEPEAV